MKRIFIVLVCLILMRIDVASAQQKSQLVDNSEYDQLKRDNQLSGNEIIRENVPAANLRVSPADPRPASVGCDYWMTPDGTWQVVPFTNGTAPEYRNDDGSSPLITLPFSFCLYGALYTNCYINNNGNISFDLPYNTFNANGFPDPSHAMVAPFWADVDTRGLGNGSGIIRYKLTPTYLIVQWDHVGYYGAHTDKLNSFQLIISDGLDPIIRNGRNVSFFYKDMQWTTGDASLGVGGFGGIAATVGVNRGNGVDYIQIGTFDTTGTSYNGPTGPPGGISFLDYAYFAIDACFSNANVPPIANSPNACDTVHVCAGDTFLLSATFLSPEPGQLTTAAFNGFGMQGTTILSNTSGNIASIAVQIVPQQSSVGYHAISLSGSDDGSPSETTFIIVVVDVMPASTAAFSTSPMSVCSGDTVSLAYTGNGLPSANYNWNFSGASIISGSGMGPYELYWNSNGPHSVQLTVSDNGGCRDSSASIVQVNQLPIVYALHTDLHCNGDNSGVASIGITAGTAPYNYVWNSNPVQNSDTAFNLAAGTYTAIVSDANGCVSQASATLTEPPPLNVSSRFLNDSCGSSDGSVDINVSGGATPYHYSWNGGPPQETSTIRHLSAGFYSITITDNNGCSSLASGSVISGPKPEAEFDFNPYPVFFYDPKCTFSDKSTNAVRWHWDFADGETSDEQNPVHYFKTDGLLPVKEIVYNNFGCPDTFSREVTVEEFYSFYLPTSFTPDHDGTNGIFIPYTTGVSPANYEMQIFDRWGKEIFSSNDILLGWDGHSPESNSMVPGGMYVYHFKYSDYKNRVHEAAGTVMVLR